MVIEHVHTSFKEKNKIKNIDILNSRYLTNCNVSGPFTLSNNKIS